MTQQQIWTSTDEARLYGRALLSNDRVLLRPTTDDDLTHLAKWWVDPEWAALQQLVVRPRPEATNVDTFRAWSNNAGGDLGAGFSVVLANTGELVGHVILHGRHQPARIGTYAIVIGSDHLGKGLGTEATRMMIRYGFEELGLHKIELQVWSYNSRAIRSYTNAGFVIEGERRAAAFHAGAFHGETLMGILAEEYQHGRTATS